MRGLLSFIGLTGVGGGLFALANADFKVATVAIVAGRGVRGCEPVP